MLFWFLVVFNSFFTLPVRNENARITVALAIPTGAQIAVPNDAIEMLEVATDKKINDLLK